MDILEVEFFVRLVQNVCQIIEDNWEVVDNCLVVVAIRSLLIFIRKIEQSIKGRVEKVNLYKKNE